MKLFKYGFILTLFAFFASCDQDGYIDDITPVAPGPDLEAPDVTISFPREGSEIQVLERVTSVNIEFEVIDDIEIASIRLLFDGNQLASWDSFKDFRVVKEEYLYENVTDGDHVITVEATDIDGKVTSQEVNFSKVPAYVPKYRGEMLYMPFDDSYVDLVGIRFATEVGTPGFAGEGAAGGDAYAGAEGAYLTFPTDGMLGNEFSATFWMQVNSSPDRAGIIVIGPPDDANPASPNNRTSGFRFFRENAGGEQRFKLNVGRGDGDSWFDGGENADVIPNTGEWTHFAFTISQSRSAVYINGQVVREGDFGGVDWTNCDIVSIMSGEPRFTGWNHRSDQSFMDELRFFNVALTEQEIATIIQDDGGSVDTGAEFGEVLYMPFDGDFNDVISGTSASEVGSPTFAGDSKDGSDAYAGAEDSYLTIPIDGLDNSEFSATFWLNINDTPDRAGILVAGPEDADNPDAQNLRTNGFRFFREASNGGETQRFKLNLGNGAGDNWFDGGADADVDPTTGDWVFFAFSVSESNATVYINGEVARTGDFGGIDWTGVDFISVMSGAPRFTGWGHRSDLSLMDELRIFDRAITQAEVEAIMASDN
jgi:hypothetical protein